MSVVWGCLLSANANNGANAGFGYLNANNRSSNSNANSGFRFYRLVSIEKKDTEAADTLPLGRKIVINTVRVRKLKALY